ncbi:hypothetical protein LVY75_22680 [Sinorhizobium sp. B11]
MYLSDFDAKAHVKGLFDLLKADTMASMPPNVDFNLRFIGEDSLRMAASIVPAAAGQWRFEVLITNRLLHLITATFFALARCIPSVVGIELPKPEASGVPLPFIAGLETVEQKLNQIPNDIELEGPRVQLFEDFLNEVWSVLLYHEFAHITEGHLLFMTENSALFKKDWAAYDPAYSRAMELEADYNAGYRIKNRVAINPADWLCGISLGDNVARIDPLFTGLAVSVLFLVMRVHTGLGTEDYMPSEIRHYMLVIAILEHAPWSSQEERNAATMKLMVDAPRLLDLILGIPQEDKDIYIANMSFDDQDTWVAQVMDEYSALNSAWKKYRFHNEPLL